MKCLTDLELKALEKEGEWALLAPLIWELDNKQRLEVPKGFKTDLASIPRIFQNILSVTGKSRRAAVGHDYLYRAHIGTRKEADEFLRLALIAEGMNPITAGIYWSGVRIGGWVAWGNRPNGLLKEDFV